MKRVICLLLACVLLMGCEKRIVAPISNDKEAVAVQTASAQPTATASPAPATPEPTAAPRPVLATFSPLTDREALFAEELISQDGEPIASMIRSLLEAGDLTKESFSDRFLEMIDRADELEANILRLLSRGRTMTADRTKKTIDAFMGLTSQETQDALLDAYSLCPGEGKDLPLFRYSASMDAILRDLQGMEERTEPFFRLDKTAAGEYKTVLERYMGEPILPRKVLDALEELAQTEAYALATALQADPEAARKKEPISFGGYAQNMSFLCRVTQALCPLPDGSALPIPHGDEASEAMDVLELAFQMYPGMAFLRLYASRSSREQQDRWANAPEGYLTGLAVHCSYAVVPYLSDFGLEYVQYKWYEELLDVTLTGISALLIHYYGYSEKDLTGYLESWGADSFAGYLYDKAMTDPFDSLVACYGYYRYLDICQAALDAGCESEQRFLRDYLSAGPAPFESLKEYMVGLYKNKVDKPLGGE